MSPERAHGRIPVVYLLVHMHPRQEVFFRPMHSSDSRKVIYAAIVANIAIAAVKYVAATFTKSSAMLAEAIHSTVDTGNELLLLLGMKRSIRPADALHPFGHGKALYFYSLLVAVYIFALGGGLAVYRGVLHLRAPTLPDHAGWNYGNRYGNHFRNVRMKERLATKEADVTDTASVQNLKGRIETRRVYPPQVLMKDFAIRKVAEIAGRIAGIRDSNIAQGGATVTKKPQQIPRFGSRCWHRYRLDASWCAPKSVFWIGTILDVF